MSTRSRGRRVTSAVLTTTLAPHREDLRRRFLKAETSLFRLRFESDDAAEREAFLKTLNFDWVAVTAQEKADNRSALLATSPWLTQSFESEAFFKVSCTL